MKKRTLIWAICALAFYGILLALLVWAESAHPETGIRSLGDALWYSLVTLTTVGYGDLYPVSTLGRIIGFIFLLLSVGLLASVLGTAVVFLRGRFSRLLRSTALRGRKCYVFSHFNEIAVAIAGTLPAQNPEWLIIFCGQKKNPDIPSIPSRRVLSFPEEAAEIRQKLSVCKETSVFLVSDNMAENYAAAEALKAAGTALYCRGIEAPGMPEVHFFDTDVCAARAFWAKHPLKASENRAVLIGDGALAQELLNQALLINCRVPFLKTAYTAFGNWSEYQRFHPVICQTMLDAGVSGDSLVFPIESWNTDPALLENADRIVFCWDEPDRNVQAAVKLLRAFPISGKVYAAAPTVPAPAIAFGGLQETCTYDVIVQSELDRRAIALHKMYCQRTDSNTSWEELSSFLKASNRASADHMPVKIRLLLNDDIEEMTPEACQRAAAAWQATRDPEPFRRNEHERWMRFHLLYNWRYGPEKDSLKRTHPCIIPYDSLSQEEREKDDSAWQQIGSLFTGRGETP